MQSLAIQENGRIVAAGGNYGDFALARYRRDGVLDTTFDGDGRVTTDFGSAEDVLDIVVQDDGKIVVVGWSDRDDDLEDGVGDFALARYNPDGSLDASFGVGGKVLTFLGEPGRAQSVALQADGRIVVAGGAMDVMLARYLPDGSLDPSFDGDGKKVVDLGEGTRDWARDIVIQSDGKIVVAGFFDAYGGSQSDADFLLARFKPDGSLDTMGLDPYLDAPFGADGKVTTDFAGGYEYAYTLAIEPGGKLVVAGSRWLDAGESASQFAVARYNVDGSLDQSFGIGGKVLTPLINRGEARGVAVQADGAIVAAGWTNDWPDWQFAVARYLAAPCCVVGVPAP